MLELRKFHKITELRDVIKDDGNVVHEVYGICTSEQPDCDNEICDYGDTKPLYEEWSNRCLMATKGAGQEPSYGNVRVQHTMEVGGKATRVDYMDDEKCIAIATEPIDDEMWRKLLKGFYTGYSQGGGYAYRKCNVCKTDMGEDPKNFLCPKCNKERAVRYACAPGEISYVDNPANSGATFTHVKVDGSKTLVKFAAQQVTQKGGKTKRVAGEDLSSSAFAYVGDPNETSTWKLPIKFSSDEKTKSHIRNALARFSATEGIPQGERASVRARIVAAARRHGIHVSGSKSAGGFMVIKSLYHIETAVEILARIRYLRDSNASEGEYEGDDRDTAIAEALQELLVDGVDILKQIVEDETTELVAVNKAAAISKGVYMNELLKAARKSLNQHFTKAAAHHKAMAEEHEQTAAEQKALGETCKAIMADDECKSMHDHAKAMGGHASALADRHTKMAKAHKAQIAHCEAMAAAHSDETTKAIEDAEVAKAASVAAPKVPATTATDPTPATGTAATSNDLQSTVDGMVSKALTEAVGRVQGSEEVQKAIDTAVASALMARLGSQVLPTTVKTAGPALVLRGDSQVTKGAAAADGEFSMAGVPLDLADMLETEFE